MDEETENKELEAMLKTRYISFPGKFEPVKHKCRVPLPNGSLCERQDRIKVGLCCKRVLFFLGGSTSRALLMD